MKILVVEDQKSHAHMLHLILKKNSKAEIVFAKDAFEAYAVIKAITDFDAIVLDNDMPFVKGLQLLEKLKSQESTKDIDVIVSTADEDVQAHLDAGAIHSLTKPYHVQELVDIVFSEKKT